MELDTKVVAEFLAALVQGSDQVERSILEYIDIEFFADEESGGVNSYKWLAKQLKERDWEPIAVDFLDQLLLGVEDLETRGKYRAQIQALYHRDLSFVKDANKKFKDFVAYCVINSTLRGSLEGYNRTNRIDYLINDLQEVSKKSEDIVYGGQGLKSIDYIEDYHNRQQTRLERKLNPNLNPRVLTGIAGLDTQFQIRAPQIVSFLAPTKRYKSIVLNDIGFAALLQGFNVFHASFENKYEMTADRYDALFSMIDYDRISSGLILPEEKQKLDATFEWMSTWDSRLEVAEARRNETTVESIRKLLERLKYKKGFVPHVVVLDYFNLVKPVKNHKQDWLSQEEVIWDLKALAEDYNCAVIGASQSNREGLDAERLKMGHQGRSLGFLQAVDLSIAIDQTSNEKAEGLVIFSPLVSRAGHIRIPEIVMDSALSWMMISKELHKLWDHAAKIFPFEEK